MSPYVRRSLEASNHYAVVEATADLGDRIPADRLILSEVWCANDDRPAIVNRPVRRNGRVELRALCADCNWKLMPADPNEKPINWDRLCDDCGRDDGTHNPEVEH
jgi:hypothetical protein